MGRRGDAVRKKRENWEKFCPLFPIHVMCNFEQNHVVSESKNLPFPFNPERENFGEFSCTWRYSLFVARIMCLTGWGDATSMSIIADGNNLYNSLVFVRDFIWQTRYLLLGGSPRRGELRLGLHSRYR